MFIGRLAGLLVSALLVPVFFTTANAQQTGRWSVTLFPEVEGKLPRRCDLSSALDGGARFVVRNVYREEFKDKPNYYGSGRVSVVLNDSSLFSVEKANLKNQTVRIPGRAEWTTQINWRKRGNRGFLVFDLEDDVAKLLPPIARGNVLEIDINAAEANVARTLSISLAGSWKAALSYEKCLVQ